MAVDVSFSLLHKRTRNSIQFTSFTDTSLENDNRNQNKSFSQNEVSELLSKYCTEHGLFGHWIPSRRKLFSLKYFDKCMGYIIIYIQLWAFAYIRLLDKLYKNEVTLRGQNPPLKYCQPLVLLTHFENG